MGEMPLLFLALMSGVGLGAIFFGGLWLTIRISVVSARPALWFLGSALLRVSVVVGGFYFASGGERDRLLACLVGFALTRLAATRLMRLGKNIQASQGSEIGHAP